MQRAMEKAESQSGGRPNRTNVTVNESDNPEETARTVTERVQQQSRSKGGQN